MSKVVFDCPHCGQELEISEAGATGAISCPACGKTIASPMSRVRFWNFDCPVCGQNLEVEAADAGAEVDCPKCTSRLRAPSPGKPVEVIAASASEKKSETTRIEIPLGGGLPPPRSRHITIKRPDGRHDRSGGGAV